MDVENTSVEPLGSKLPMRSGTLILIRYQLNASLPAERRRSKVVGSITSHLESSKSGPPAWGVKSYVLFEPPVGWPSAPAALKSISTIFVSLYRHSPLTS